MAVPMLDLFLPYTTLTSPDDPDEFLFDEMLEQAVLADRLGYDRIWIPEHHFVKIFQSPSPTMLAVQVGSAVKCKVGIMAAIIPFHHPLTIAGEIALADRLLHGRFEAGLGRGNYSHEFKYMQLDRDKSSKVFSEGVDIILEALKGRDGASFHGDEHQFENVTVFPKPHQTPHPPIWLAGRSRSTVERAAELGLNLATWPVAASDDVVAEALAWFRGASTGPRVGHRQEFATLRQTFVTTSEAEHKAVGEMVLKNHRINRALHHNAVEVIDSSGYVAPEPLVDEPSVEDLTEHLLIGDAEYCLARLENYAKMGVDHVITQHAIGMSHEETLASIERLATVALKQRVA